MQEDLEQRTVSVSIQAAKLSGRVLRAAIAAVLQKMEQERTMPKVGRNSMKRLTYKDPGANTHPCALPDRRGGKYRADPEPGASYGDHPKP